MNSKEFKTLQKKVSEIQNSYEREIAQGYLDTLATLKLELSEIYEKHAVNGVVARDVWYKYGHLKRIEKELVEKINALTPLQINSIRQSIVDTFQETFYRNGYYIASQAQLAIPIFYKLTQKAIDAIVFNPLDKIKWSNRHRANNKGLIQKLKSALVNGIKNGHSYEKIAKAITTEIDISKRKAIKVAQTETARAVSTAKQQTMEEAQSAGVVMKKRWLCTLDNKTRDTHKHLDGQTVGVDDYFISGSRKAKAPHGFGDAKEDINCRCTVISVFEGLEPTVRMAREVANERGEITSYKNYNEWRESLTNK